jgi:hypothetical protein
VANGATPGPRRTRTQPWRPGPDSRHRFPVPATPPQRLGSSASRRTFRCVRPSFRRVPSPPTDGRAAAGCGPVGDVGRPGGGGTGGRPSALIGSWHVDARSATSGAVLTLAVGTFKVQARCGEVTGSWKAATGGPFSRTRPRARHLLPEGPARAVSVARRRGRVPFPRKRAPAAGRAGTRPRHAQSGGSAPAARRCRPGFPGRQGARASAGAAACPANLVARRVAAAGAAGHMVRRGRSCALPRKRPLVGFRRLRIAGRSLAVCGGAPAGPPPRRCERPEPPSPCWSSRTPSRARRTRSSTGSAGTRSGISANGRAAGASRGCSRAGRAADLLLGAAALTTAVRRTQRTSGPPGTSSQA